MDENLNVSVRRLSSSATEISWKSDEMLSDHQTENKGYRIRISGKHTNHVFEAAVLSESQSVVLDHDDVYCLQLIKGDFILINASIPIRSLGMEQEVRMDMLERHKGLSVDAQEAVIVTLILLLWICALLLFVRRWGKIRMLVPHQPRYAYEQAPTSDQFKPLYLYGRRGTTTLELMESTEHLEPTLRRHSTAVPYSRFAAAALDIAASRHSLATPTVMLMSQSRPRLLPRPLLQSRRSSGQERCRSALDLRNMERLVKARRATAIGKCGDDNEDKKKSDSNKGDGLDDKRVANVCVIVDGLPEHGSDETSF